MIEELQSRLNVLTVSILMSALTALIVSRTLEEPYADHAMTIFGMLTGWFLVAMTTGWGKAEVKNDRLLNGKAEEDLIELDPADGYSQSLKNFNLIFYLLAYFR